MEPHKDLDDKSIFTISEQQKEMLMRSEEDILNGDLITDEELNKEEDEWLN
ncbi:MAG: hypothetical protein ACTHK0_18810 [Ginsengibacter sp.]